MYAESAARSRSGFAGAMTEKPRSCSFSTTAFQPDELSQPPCTSTIVGMGVSGVRCPESWADANATAPNPRRGTRVMASAVVSRRGAVVIRCRGDIARLHSCGESQGKDRLLWRHQSFDWACNCASQQL